MNQDQVTSLVRQLLLSVGGGLVTKGYIDGGSWAVIASGLATIIVTGGWALYTRRGAGLIASAAAQPDVRQIIADATTAAAVPSMKVVPPGSPSAA